MKISNEQKDWDLDSPRKSVASGGNASREWRKFRAQLQPKIKRLEHRIDRVLDRMEAEGSEDEPKAYDSLRLLRRKVHSLASELDERPESSNHWQVLHASILSQWEAISRSARMTVEILPEDGDGSGSDVSQSEGDSHPAPFEVRHPRLGPKR